MEELFPPAIFNIEYSTNIVRTNEDPPASGYSGGTRAEYTCSLPMFGVSGQSFDLCQQNLEFGVLISVNWDIRNRTCESK